MRVLALWLSTRTFFRLFRPKNKVTKKAKFCVKRRTEEVFEKIDILQQAVSKFWNEFMTDYLTQQIYRALF